ncbi:MAG TPA: DUF4160 domain-containing protein [Thermoanaerobaculia bacterium]|nr:DUF4160 domain-containing protein [Thermoanaerobaculia bacterium]
MPELLRLALRRGRAACPHLPGSDRCAFFYSNEGTERPHVHVQHESRVAKFWLRPGAGR